MHRLILIIALVAQACSTGSGCERGTDAPRRVEPLARPMATGTAFGPATDLDGAVDATVDGAVETTGDGAVDATGDADRGSSSITIAVVSDLNGAYGSTTYGEPVHGAVRRIVGLRPDLVIAVGDMVAGQREGLDYRAMWSAFHSAVTEPLASVGIPLAVTPGNHDGSGYAEYADERSIFVDEWSSRRPSVRLLDASTYPLMYSFMVGQVLFLSLDATVIGPLPADQLTWVRSQLEAERSRVATIVFGHLPLHPVAVGRETEFMDDPRLESLLVEHDVDLYLSGHHHAFYPARRGSLRLVAVGCLGGGNRPLLGAEDSSPKTLVMVEVDSSGEVAVDAFTGSRFDTPMNWTSLPSQLGEGEHLLLRADRR